ncbi:MAG TPA: deoxyribonuclease IV [Candidatus Polarisedimenticolia bacterium]|nr:deoxyribonuclease IV [Candidatus Polarisedimenticolia bacterium]
MRPKKRAERRKRGTPPPAPARARLGSHISIAGGVDRAVLRGKTVGCEALQIFVKSSNQWRAAPFRAGEAERFAANLRMTGLGPVIAHDSYLINLCSPDDALWEKSIQAFAVELERCETLGIPYLVTHPGCHMGSGERAGLARLSRGIDRVHAKYPSHRVKILLETTAGQGSGLGHRFDHLGAVLKAVDDPARVGVCLDTCHVFAAGYDLRTASSYARTLEEFDSRVGTSKLQAIHLNDSKRELGSRVDRHEQIGKGHLGIEAFRLLLVDSRLQDVPMVLETPKGPDYAEDKVNLALLRSLIA